MYEILCDQLTKIHLNWSIPKETIQRVNADFPIPLSQCMARILHHCNRPFGFKKIEVELDTTENLSLKHPNFQFPDSLRMIGLSSKTGFEIYFSITLPDGFRTVKKFLPALLSHEFAHFARKELGVNPSKRKCPSLLDAIITEGTAIRFQRSLYPNLNINNGLDDVCVSLRRLSELSAQAWAEKDQAWDMYMKNRWSYGLDLLPIKSIYHVADFLVGKYVKKVKPSLPELVVLTEERLLAAIPEEELLAA